jgi:GTPase-activating protein SAC7
MFMFYSHAGRLVFTDLAVIFRPGLMSHPSHELSPTEHRLSQEVLEFLIAHQDWFMLDTPPPPALSPTPSRSLTPPLTSTANISVSDDEGPDGWRLIDRHPRAPADRGKHGVGASAAVGKGEKDEVSQPSAAGKQSMGGAPGIVRSRTMPSSRKGRASTVDAGVVQRGTPGASGSALNPAVLRKARRASAQPT